MRPSLIQCFPHPFTRQWPTRSAPVTFECRQLYALVAVCCCVPNTHLLVLHEAAQLHSSLITSMPKGPKYVDFTITPRTTPEDLCSFLVRAELAASGVFVAPSSGGSGGNAGPLLADEVSAFPPVTPGDVRLDLSTMAGAILSMTVAQSRAKHGKSSITSPAGTVAQRQVVVVCLHGIAEASASVQSVLMDLLMFEQVRNHHRAVGVPTLRIVAFCSSRNYAMLLPEPLRALFTLSMYVSTMASDSEVVLQTTTAASSNIVNKRFMMEVITALDGQSLVETVTLSGSVTRYLRHLLLVARGSFLPALSPGALALRRIPRWKTILKALAILFMPDEDLLRARVQPMRAALLQSYSRSTFAPSLEKSATSAFHRSAATSRTSTLGTPPVPHSHQQQRQPHRLGNSASLVPSEDRAGEYAATDRSSKSTGSESGGASIESFHHVVVSPSDVACIFPCLFCHLLTLPREMVPSDEILSATATMGIARGASNLTETYAGMLETQQRGRIGFSLQDPTMWDAVAASWSLRNLRGITNPYQTSSNTFESSFAEAPFHQNPSVSLFSMEGNDGVRDAAGSQMRNRGVRLASFTPPEALKVPAPGTRGEQYQTLNNRPLFSVREAWRWSATDKFSVLDIASTPLLDYWEAREAVRATLLCRSAPAPG